MKKISLPPIGEVIEDDMCDEWWISQQIKIPFLDDQKLAFTITEQPDGNDFSADISEAIQNFLSLSIKERLIVNPYIFKDYQNHLEAGYGKYLNFTITSENNVWQHIRPAEIHVSRRLADKLVYIIISAGCDWEMEHGLQIVFREGKNLSRVSDIDGHISWTDAYDLPEEQDRII